jgi:hypothetical protein
VSDTGFEDELPGRISWKLSASRMFLTSKNKYEWTGEAKLRINSPTRPGGPYLSAGLDWIYDERGFVVNPGAEVGYQVFLGSGFFSTAFLRWERVHDADVYLGRMEDFVFFGFEIGRMIPCTETGEEPCNGSGRGIGEMQIHATGGYAYMGTNRDFGYKGDTRFWLTPPSAWFAGTEVGLEIFAGITTPPGDLNPNTIVYRAKPSLAWTAKDVTLSVHFEYSRRECVGYKIADKETREKHALGVTVRNHGLAPPEGEGEAPFLPELRFHFDPEWDMTVEVFLKGHRFDFDGEIRGSVALDVVTLDVFAVYFRFNASQLCGGRAPLGYGAETGVRMEGETGTTALYIRFQKDVDPFRFKDNSEQILFGFKFVF